MQIPISFEFTVKIQKDYMRASDASDASDACYTCDTASHSWPFLAALSHVSQV